MRRIYFLSLMLLLAVAGCDSETEEVQNLTNSDNSTLDNKRSCSESALYQKYKSFNWRAGNGRTLKVNMNYLNANGRIHPVIFWQVEKVTASGGLDMTNRAIITRVRVAISYKKPCGNWIVSTNENRVNTPAGSDNGWHTLLNGDSQNRGLNRFRVSLTIEYRERNTSRTYTSPVFVLEH